MKTITINGEEYTRTADIINNTPAKSLDGMPYVLVRADRAGVFVGYLKSKECTTVVLNQCRRLWYWDGASSISEIAVHGVSKPENCKFPVEVTEIDIMGVIEILQVTEEARLNISQVPVWTQN